MNWLEAAEAAPSIEAKDIVHLSLSVEETEKLVALYARSLTNARSDSADIAMIALKKALSEYPAWGEAALLYGICLALDGKLKRAKASFEHALSVGLVSDQNSYLTQMCFQLAISQTENPTEQNKQEDSVSLSRLFGGKTAAKKKKSIFEQPNAEENGRMTAPILTRAPKSPSKARMASDRERRDVLMQANSANPDAPDEEIDVSIPKTPAEKLRIVLSLLGIIIASALFGLFVWYIAIPGVKDFMASREDSSKLAYLKAEMEKSSEDPEIKRILEAFASKYPENEANPDVSSSTSAPAVSETTTGEGSADISPVPETTTLPNPPESTAGPDSTSDTGETTTLTSDISSGNEETTNTGGA